MNVSLWILAGGLLGALALAYLDTNSGRGWIVAIIIGAAAGFFGGNVLAPVFELTAADAAAFRPFALMLACVSAVVVLSLSDLVYERYGF